MLSHQELIDQARHDLCTEAEVRQLVQTFYTRARADHVLGPVFLAHVGDWDWHLAQLTDFWSGLLRGTGRYSGKPMPMHLALPDVTAQLFLRWLALFEQVTAELGNEAMRVKANGLGAQIAERLWRNYQLHHRPHSAPCTLRES